MVKASFGAELTRLVYEGGGKDEKPAEALRFQDLQLFEDDQLDQSIEVARATQEVALAVDDSLPALDALVSTMLGWRTIQPGLNPIRPEVFVRSLQATLAQHVPENAQIREVLIVPAGGLLGVSLRRLYRELSDWLRSTGVEPAVPLGGRINKSTGATGKTVTDTVAKTLLTLDRLRKLLAGDFDQPKQGRTSCTRCRPRCRCCRTSRRPTNWSSASSSGPSRPPRRRRRWTCWRTSAQPRPRSSRASASSWATRSCA